MECGDKHLHVAVGSLERISSRALGEQRPFGGARAAGERRAGTPKRALLAERVAATRR